jgi:hypothetical protein
MGLHARQRQLDGERAIDLINQAHPERVLSISDRLDADLYL